MIRRTPEVKANCRRCGNCCRWPGIVRILPAEVDAIARSLSLAALEFTARFTRLLPSRTGLSLIETEDGACVFLANNDCQIHNAKPRQCRDFPDVWTRDLAETQCRAYDNASAS